MFSMAFKLLFRMDPPPSPPMRMICIMVRSSTDRKPLQTAAAAVKRNAASRTYAAIECVPRDGFSVAAQAWATLPQWTKEEPPKLFATEQAERGACGEICA
jgi:hypothetical protein